MHFILQRTNKYFIKKISFLDSIRLHLLSYVSAGTIRKSLFRLVRGKLEVEDVPGESNLLKWKSIIKLYIRFNWVVILFILTD